MLLFTTSILSYFPVDTILRGYGKNLPKIFAWRWIAEQRVFCVCMIHLYTAL